MTWEALHGMGLRDLLGGFGRLCAISEDLRLRFLVQQRNCPVADAARVRNTSLETVFGIALLFRVALSSGEWFEEHSEHELYRRTVGFHNMYFVIHFLTPPPENWFAHVCGAQFDNPSPTYSWRADNRL
jgi:hypothetical protein